MCLFIFLANDSVWFLESLIYSFSISFSFSGQTTTTITPGKKPNSLDRTALIFFPDNLFFLFLAHSYLTECIVPFHSCNKMKYAVLIGKNI